MMIAPLPVRPPQPHPLQPRPPRRRPPSVIALGFRPFFLLAGVGAIALIVLWLGMLQGYVTQPLRGPVAINWHAHEMLFGYTMAVIAGFLLTAARNWSGIATPTGWSLAALAGLWLAGRLAPWTELPPLVVALIDLTFLPALTLALWRALWHGPKLVNRWFVLLLAAMFGANLLVQAQALGWLAGGAVRGHQLMIDLVVVLIMLVAGRVMPFFINSVLVGAQPRRWAWVEGLTFALALALLILHLARSAALGADAVPLYGLLVGTLTLALALLQVARLAGWHDPRIWHTPMLAVLAIGYLWLIVGLVLDSLPTLGWLAPYRTVHALTIGALGTLTLGMMARVSIGHTGRAMVAARLTVLAFGLINLAALARVFGPIALPGLYLQWMLASGLCWCAAFGLFLWVHAPYLVTPRPDGRPG